MICSGTWIRVASESDLINGYQSNKPIEVDIDRLWCWD